MRLRSAIVAVGFVLAISTAAATAQQSAFEHFMETWDLNGDGSITLQEIQTERERLFPAFDANGDGFLDRQEYAEFDKSRSAGIETASPEQRARMKRIAEGLSLARNDANGDGRVSKAEFVGAAEAWFKALDRNGDGVVNLRDFAI